MTRQRLVRAIASAVIALTTKGQSLLFLLALLAYGGQSDIVRFGQYTSMQMLIGYVLFFSTAFAHGRLIFTGKETREYRYIPVTASVLSLQCIILLLISLIVHVLCNPMSIAANLLSVSIACSIILYLASEHFVTTARSVDNSYYLGMTGVIRLLSAGGLFGVGYFTRSITFDQFLFSISTASLLVSVIGYIVFRDKYQLFSGARHFWIDSRFAFGAMAFSLQFSLLPLCVWIQNLSGRLIVSPQASSAPGYTVYSFAAANASIVTLIVFDSMRSSIYNISSDHIPDQWLRVFRMTTLVSALNFALYGLVIVGAVHLYTQTHDLHFDARWYTLLSLSIALTFLSGVSEWLCVSVGTLKILNLAMTFSTILFGLHLLMQRTLASNDIETALITSSISSSLLFSCICIAGNLSIVRRLVAASLGPTPGAGGLR
ncbi:MULTISPECIES: hypothetical protein [unclassified Bradyrhizobium]|uniref:hypothetical protein n=1 Tax=unclassified Bradyrhizobium TaxID=2631580 RepID=UPI001FFFA870|nr:MULTISPECIES: hypothetical protein [unclassified Bradyrhizobium]UPJ26023.1 hypothetical protein IVB54_29955 [Bradyrhizobium sp. CW1]UPJ94587.1 hypothetical protein IVB07_29530 [Bradyrhizobium sp. 172]